VSYITSPEGQELIKSIMQACQEGRPDEAQAQWEQLQGMGELPKLAEAIPVYIMLARGHTKDALQYMNGMPDDFSPETRMLCLRMAGDPTWYSLARQLEDSPDLLIRDGVRALLESADQR